MDLRFTWHPKKAAANLRKHRVGFPEAATAFADAQSITIPDPDHSTEEERFILIGQSDRRRLVVVAHTELICIISGARLPTPRAADL
jgi:uncharacterized DUF497 family protein